MKYLFYVSLSGLFLAGIYVPLAKMIISPSPEWSFHEKRKLAELPDVDWTLPGLAKLPSGIQSYFNDHFGFRERLIKAHSRVMRKYFGKSSVSMVLLGQEDWMYITDRKLIEDFVGHDPFTQEDLYKWKVHLETKHKWFSDQGIYYLFVIVPAKQTIYPEYLPAHLQDLRKPSRLDQLLEFLGDQTDLPILDLRQPLLEAKGRQRIYYRTDTHWNARGAFVGYQNIMNQVTAWFPQFTPNEEKFTEVGLGLKENSDLSFMLKLTTTDEEPLFEIQPQCAERKKLDFKNWKPFMLKKPWMTECEEADKRAVFVGDSNIEALEPFVAEAFNQVIWLWWLMENGFLEKQADFDLMKKIIKEFQPHVVIEEMGERRFVWVRKHDQTTVNPVTLANEQMPAESTGAPTQTQ